MWDLIVSVLDHCSSFYFGEISENELKNNILILNDRRRTSVPYFSSKNRTLLIYLIFRLVVTLISFEISSFLRFQVLAFRANTEMSQNIQTKVANI